MAFDLEELKKKSTAAHGIVAEYNAFVDAFVQKEVMPKADKVVAGMLSEFNRAAHKAANEGRNYAHESFSFFGKGNVFQGLDEKFERKAKKYAISPCYPHISHLGRKIRAVFSEKIRVTEPNIVIRAAEDAYDACRIELTLNW
ncbi:MAG: hypothetical protein LBN30_10440 [Oscillospiraceae bacterium]|jgi:hypothetical protein|nr:hypothetical protein [Oscillospiraceae bacterium]